MKTYKALAMVLVMAAVLLGGCEMAHAQDGGVVAVASATTAPSAPTSLGELASLAQQTFQQGRMGNYKWLAAGIIMLLVGAFRIFVMPRLSLSTKALPYISGALGGLGMLATSLASGTSVMQSVADGVFAGLAASGLWGWVPKPSGS